MSSRSVIVTGANRGIGFAVARALATRGCRVVLLARDAKAGETAARLLSSQGDVELVVGDLASVESVRKAASRLVEVCPRADVLVHNAGVWPSRVELIGGVERAFTVNHLAPFLLNHLLAP